MSQIYPKVGIVGLGRQGKIDLKAISRHAQVTAICDVDNLALKAAKLVAGNVICFEDYIDLIKFKDVEAVVISTPDHLHVQIILECLKFSKHCFCQKPLGIDLSELRNLDDRLPFTNAVTQLCIQGLFHSRASLTIKLIKEGIIGSIQEIHSWTDRPGNFWANTLDKSTNEIPANLNWGKWLGKLPRRDYNPAYHPTGWRNWFGMGSGPLGDMGVHNLALAFACAEFQSPNRVYGEFSNTLSKDQFPHSAHIIIEMINKKSEVIPIFWYHGNDKPPQNLFSEMRIDENGCLIVGSKGICYTAGSMNQYIYFLPSNSHRELIYLNNQIELNVYENWLYSCRNNLASKCDFTQTMLLSQTIAFANQFFFSEREIKWISE